MKRKKEKTFKEFILKNSPNKERFNYEAILRTGLNLIPHIGGALNEVLFESRSRLKQERINSFVIHLQEMFKNLNIELIHKNVIKEDGYADIFESILREVSITRSDQKRNYFAKLLVNQTITPVKLDKLEIFFDILKDLNQNEIIILDNYFIEASNNLSHYKNKINETVGMIDFLSRQLSTTPKSLTDGLPGGFSSGAGYRMEINTYNKSLRVNIKEYEKEYEGMMNRIGQNKLNEMEYNFYLNSLVNKNLLERFKMPDRTIKFDHYEITSLGKELIEFLKQ